MRRLIESACRRTAPDVGRAAARCAVTMNEITQPASAAARIFSWKRPRLSHELPTCVQLCTRPVASLSTHQEFR